MQTPGFPVSRPYVAAMKAAPCSCRVRISSIEELRKLSTTSRFSSPGTPKMRSTPSFSSAATSKSEPFGISALLIFLLQSRNLVSIETGEHGFAHPSSGICATDMVEREPVMVAGWRPSVPAVSLCEDRFQQQPLHVERRHGPATEQIRTVRNDQRTVVGA